MLTLWIEQCIRFLLRPVFVIFDVFLGPCGYVSPLATGAPTDPGLIQTTVVCQCTWGCNLHSSRIIKTGKIYKFVLFYIIFILKMTSHTCNFVRGIKFYLQHSVYECAYITSFQFLLN